MIPENLENISNFEGWGPTLVAYKKSVTTAGREQEVEFSGSPDNENTNEEENSFAANSFLMLQQAQNNSISTTVSPQG